jgi:co-chaperonin GroES (HSP10)
MMQNESGLEPLGRAVLVRPYQPEQKASLIVIPDSVRASQATVEQRAVVVAIGPACWPDEPARAKPGDKVLVSKFAGYIAKGTADGQLYTIINDRDIFARISGEA